MPIKENYWSTPQKVASYIAESKDYYEEIGEYFIDLVRNLVKKDYPLGTDFLIDLGCGPGIFSDILIKAFNFKRLHAIDISEAMLDVVPWYVDLEKTKTSMQRADLSKCRFAVDNNVANFIVSSATMSYVDSITNVFAESARVLKENGLFLFDASIHHENSLAPGCCKGNGWPMTAYAHSFRLIMQVSESFNLKLVSKNSVASSHGFRDVRAEHVVLIFKK